MRKRSYDCNYDGEIDAAYKVQSEARVVVGAIVGVGAVVGALSGLRFSFTALSPLVAGGIIGAAFPFLLVLVTTELSRCFRGLINKFEMDTGIAGEDVIAAFSMPFLLATVASVATGVFVAAAVNAVFPGIFATWWAVAVGAGIGAVTLPTGIITGITAVAIFAGSMSESAIQKKFVDVK